MRKFVGWLIGAIWLVVFIGFIALLADMIMGMFPATQALAIPTTEPPPTFTPTATIDPYATRIIYITASPTATDPAPTAQMALLVTATPIPVVFSPLIIGGIAPTREQPTPIPPILVTDTPDVPLPTLPVLITVEPRSFYVSPLQVPTQILTLAPTSTPVPTATLTAVPPTLVFERNIPTVALFTGPCHPSYQGICLPIHPTDDINCDDPEVGGQRGFTVVGPDDYGLDDGDGIACE